MSDGERKHKGGSRGRGRDEDGQATDREHAPLAVKGRLVADHGAYHKQVSVDGGDMEEGRTHGRLEHVNVPLADVSTVQRDTDGQPFDGRH